MRFSIKLRIESRKKFLPMDYQYFIGAWIYKVIARADKEYADFLHKVGYREGNKSFKLFNYSPLKFEKYKTWKEKSLFEVFSEEMVLHVSFFIPEAGEKFIIGLFNSQKGFLGDRFHGFDITVSQIERLADPGFQTKMVYRTLSPIVIGFRGDGDKYSQYLSPAHPDYTKFMINHIKQKAEVSRVLVGDSIPVEFQCRSDFRSKLLTMKPDTPEQTRVRGYLYEFELSAAIEIHKLLFSAGFGEKNAFGFGWGEVV